VCIEKDELPDGHYYYYYYYYSYYYYRYASQHFLSRSRSLELWRVVAGSVEIPWVIQLGLLVRMAAAGQLVVMQ